MQRRNQNFNQELDKNILCSVLSGKIHIQNVNSLKSRDHYCMYTTNKQMLQHYTDRMIALILQTSHCNNTLG